jgi:hypothetical protein
MKDIICKNGRYIQLAQDRVQWRALMTGVEALLRLHLWVFVIPAGDRVHVSSLIVHILYKYVQILKISSIICLSFVRDIAVIYLISFSHVVNGRHELVI